LSTQAPLDCCSDIVIIGAGAAGVTAAAVLGQQGHSVLLLDPNPTCPPVFKAEKIERTQLQALRNFGLEETLRSSSTHISEVHAAFDGRIFKTLATEQLGLLYADYVNALRERLPENVEFRVARVASITPSPYTPCVGLENGGHIIARLVIIACGINQALQSQLGFTREVIQKEQCLALGFNVTPANARAFPFQAVTYYPTTADDRIDYLTLFKTPNAMRANLFAFRSMADPWVREFLQEPRLQLERCFPRLPKVIGEYRVTGRVEAARIDLYRADGEPQPGVALIGDALQNVCPSTGLGFNKVFTDIDVLAECVPQWFSGTHIDSQRIASFQHNPRKLAADKNAIASAHYHRQTATDITLRWRAHRALLHAKWRCTPLWSVPSVPARALKRA
jgi:2-polyprenyl-6-methoxyphenol hydroxylase-like FAD-dependent oxidoreductase